MRLWYVIKGSQDSRIGSVLNFAEASINCIAILAALQILAVTGDITCGMLAKMRSGVHPSWAVTNIPEVVRAKHGDDANSFNMFTKLRQNFGQLNHTLATWFSTFTASTKPTVPCS